MRSALRRERIGAGKERYERLAVEGHAGFGAGEVHDRSGHIEIAHELIAGLILGDARTAHEERHLDRAFIGGGFSHQPVIAEEKAVVGGIDDDGVVELAVSFSVAMTAATRSSTDCSDRRAAR
jgi:hypothetical protein